MSLDPDIIRVDLLKVKRKIYNSYPENSIERKNFLLASKKSEIGYLSKVVPPEVVNHVYDGFHGKVKEELINCVLNLLLMGSSGLLLNALHNLNPKSVLLSFWYIPSGIFFINGMRHLWNIGYDWWGMRDFIKEYKVITDQIKKLSDEVKRIGDGK